VVSFATSIRDVPPEDINEPLAFKNAILEAGVVMNTSLVPEPKLTALLLFELDIGVVLARVFGEPVANVPNPTSKSPFVLSTIA
jgi:hypothetical protein